MTLQAWHRKKSVRRIIVVFVIIALLLAMGAGALTWSAAQSASSIGLPSSDHAKSDDATLAGFYVSPTGSDDNPGTIERPWKTIVHAVERLMPGDTLYLRKGIYYEHDIEIRLQGTRSAPITIQAYPGERAIIDGGEPFFRTVNQNEWELVNGPLQLYRSRQVFERDFVRAWLLDDDVQLVEYKAAANLEATSYRAVSGLTPFYMGPGIQLRDDGRVYIRLQSNPTDLTDATGAAIPPMPRDTNPNNNRIAVFTSESIFVLDGAAHLRFKDIEMAYSRRIMDVRNGTQNIELDGCRLRFGSYGLVIRDYIRYWDIHNNEFINGLPDHVYWTDVKNTGREAAEAYPEFQSSAIEGALLDFNIHHNTFRNTFDGMNVKTGSKFTRIADNIFRNIRDDAMELDYGISNVEVAHNMIWHVGSGISINGSRGSPGHVYIHHNVIDNSALQHGGRPGNYREDDWPVWTTIDPFSSHGSSARAGWWKIYNNTIVTRRSGYDWNAAGPTVIPGHREKYVYNNIFYVMDDRIVFRDDQSSSGARYDGNVIYRKASREFPLFYNFANGRHYNSLVEFVNTSGVDWEKQGLHVDPGFSMAVLNDPTFDAATIWNRYRSTNPAVLTAGASYQGLNWPETTGITYRGAVGP